MLTAEQHAKREDKVTGSFLPWLMAGHGPKIHREYLRLIGDPSWEPEDLSDDWGPSWGSHGEPFILNWVEKRTHPIIRRGEFVPHPTKDFFGVTLDGYREFDSTALDAKVVSAFTPIDVHVAFYTPQLIAQRACLQCMHAALLLVHGNARVLECPIVQDEAYERTLWERVDQFWWCVQNMVEPVEMHFPRVVPPEKWRTVDLDKDGADFNWAPEMKDTLDDWNEFKDEADAFKEAVDEIKTLLPADVGTLTCTVQIGTPAAAGIVIKRSRSNAVSIKRVNS